MIKVEKVTKTFMPGNISAVENCSFELPEGEIGCIIGTSGCGKTTTLKMINRLIEPTEGKISINNRESHRTNAVEWRRNIGYVIQNAGLLPHLTVKENISLLSSIMKREKSFINKRTSELLDMVHLSESEFANRYPGELSGGQKQRVGIARALMENPPVLLMDEPFGALDPITRKSLHKEFLQMNKKLNKTILFVTHDVKEAFRIGTFIILMDKGKIVRKGRNEEYFKDQNNSFVKEFIEEQLAD